MNSTFTKILRVVLALILIIFGLNKFIDFSFMPLPQLPEGANFMSSLSASGYVLPLIGVLEIFIGLLLLFKKWVPFALLVLVPISLNVLLFHLFLDIPRVLPAIIIVSINAILIYKYWKSYRPLFQ
ncbi:DoxX family membrane protein [Aureisphaera sp. CAU 1614]|uniref:DoxX family membrane protein n=1 Tax=Halomarinibacterium sedimenti TaxID=2857106 RepID=A0A9X1FMJ7_9FLAO|nr:DoxX family membrane protein [Halomarinibacterium sedimenti]MAL60590.1 DoxX protein [Flavobacteriaceae bacterium]MBW2937315.1 DoxX family membrane protein [Halomarinibacterium sedimenti]|tara:strand:- start:242120 stop:242497 length:378 start_codon:yes stop_codon:yes gene_type:complete